jgi:AraC-like DNA-binding protein
MGGPPDREIATATASTQVARAILAGAAQYGHDAGTLAARFGLSLAELADPDGRMPADVGVALWEEVPRIVDDELFGLHLGQRASDAGALPIVGYVVQTSPTLGEGIARALRFQRIVQTLNRADLHVSEGDARLVVQVRSRHVERLRHAIDFALAYVVSFASRLTGTRFVPRRARFAYATPTALDEHRRLFGDDLAFEAPATELAFDPAALERPVLAADVQLRALVERHAEALLARVPAGDSLSSRTRSALVAGLRSGRTTVDAVAGGLRMSPRTLQRRLREEGTSHAGLLDEVRRDLALRYVGDASLSLSEIAFLLGFADQTTFHRAFVRWTRKTPGAYRVALTARSQAPRHPAGSRGSRSASRRR